MVTGQLVLQAARRHVWIEGAHGPERLRVRGGERLVPGDRVVPDAGGAVSGPEPRTRTLSRRTPRGDRLLAANIDALAVVVAEGTRDGGEGFVARAIAAAAAEGIAPMLVLNKADLDDRGALADRAAAYQALGVPAFVVSAHTGAGLDALADALADRTVALVGASGVGKSSILNALDPAAARDIGDLDARGRGRHTTSLGRAVRWSRGVIVDLPGVRSFGLVTGDGLAAAFPDIAAAAQGCRFSDCAHDAEPDCAVRAAVDKGDLDPGRLETWRAIQDSVGSGAEGASLRA